MMKHFLFVLLSLVVVNTYAQTTTRALDPSQKLGALSNFNSTVITNFNGYPDAIKNPERGFSLKAGYFDIKTNNYLQVSLETKIFGRILPQYSMRKAVRQDFNSANKKSYNLSNMVFMVDAYGGTTPISHTSNNVTIPPSGGYVEFYSMHSIVKFGFSPTSQPTSTIYPKYALEVNYYDYNNHPYKGSIHNKPNVSTGLYKITNKAYKYRIARENVGGNHYVRIYSDGKLLHQFTVDAADVNSNFKFHMLNNYRGNLRLVDPVYAVYNTSTGSYGTPQTITFPSTVQSLSPPYNNLITAEILDYLDRTVLNTQVVTTNQLVYDISGINASNYKASINLQNIPADVSLVEVEQFLHFTENDLLNQTPINPAHLNSAKQIFNTQLKNAGLKAHFVMNSDFIMDLIPTQFDREHAIIYPSLAKRNGLNYYINAMKSGLYGAINPYIAVNHLGWVGENNDYNFYRLSATWQKFTGDEAFASNTRYYPNVGVQRPLEPLRLTHESSWRESSQRSAWIYTKSNNIGAYYSFINSILTSFSNYFDQKILLREILPWHRVKTAADFASPSSKIGLYDGAFGTTYNSLLTISDIPQRNSSDWTSKESTDLYGLGKYSHNMWVHGEMPIYDNVRDTTKVQWASSFQYQDLETYNMFSATGNSQNPLWAAHKLRLFNFSSFDITHNNTEYANRSIYQYNNSFTTGAIDRWKNTTLTKAQADTWNLPYTSDYFSSGTKTIYQYIRDHLGYRLELKDGATTITKNGSNLNVSMTIQNHGFAPPQNARDIYLVLLDANGAQIPSTVTPISNVDWRNWKTDQNLIAEKNTINVNNYYNFRIDQSHNLSTLNYYDYVIQGSIPLSSLPQGDYKLAIWMPDMDAGLKNLPDYAAKLANTNVEIGPKGENIFAEFSNTTVPPPPPPAGADNLVIVGGKGNNLKYYLNGNFSAPMTYNLAQHTALTNLRQSIIDLNYYDQDHKLIIITQDDYSSANKDLSKFTITRFDSVKLVSGVLTMKFVESKTYDKGYIYHGVLYHSDGYIYIANAAQHLLRFGAGGLNPADFPETGVYFHRIDRDDLSDHQVTSIRNLNIHNTNSYPSPCNFCGTVDNGFSFGITEAPNGDIIVSETSEHEGDYMNGKLIRLKANSSITQPSNWSYVANYYRPLYFGTTALTTYGSDILAVRGIPGKTLTSTGVNSYDLYKIPASQNYTQINQPYAAFAPTLVDADQQYSSFIEVLGTDAYVGVSNGKHYYKINLTTGAKTPVSISAYTSLYRASKYNQMMLATTEDKKLLNITSTPAVLDQLGFEAYAITVGEINTNTTTGIQNPNADRLLIYPNPTSDVVRLDHQGEVTVYDIYGKMHHTSYYGGGDFDVSYLPSGVYMFYLRSKSQNYIGKFTKL